MYIEQRLHHDVDAARPDSRHEEKYVKAMRAPRALQVRTEHPKEQHVEQQVQDAAMEKQVSQRLPKPQSRCNGERNQTKHSFKPDCRFGNEEVQQRLHQEHARANHDDVTNRGRQHPTPVDAGAVRPRVSGNRAHRFECKRGRTGSQSIWGVGYTKGKSATPLSASGVECRSASKDESNR